MRDNNLSQAITFLVFGIIFVLIGAGLVYCFNVFVLPDIEKYFDDQLNMVVMIGVTAVVPAYIIKLFFTYAAVKLRVFAMDSKFDVVDGLIPVLSDIKLKPLYLSMVTETYIEDADGQPIEGIGSFKRFWIKNLCDVNIILSLLFFADLFGFGIYFYLTGNMFMMTINHLFWLISLLLIYNLSITVRSMMFGITFKSMEDWILSRNPIWFVVMPVVIPCIAFLYLAFVFVGGWMFGMSVSQPFFNIISLFGVPIINPIITAVHAKLAINESKRTVDQLAIEQGMPPQTW